MRFSLSRSSFPSITPTFNSFILAILSLLLTQLFHSTLAIQLHAGEQLNEDSFDAVIQHGLWFIENYSPFCPHCKKFAPTWIELVDLMKGHELEGLNMGQIDCIAQGDLCIKLSVDFYPQMKLFEDGKFIESYTGEKTVEAISSYLDLKVKAYSLKHKTTDSHPVSIPTTTTASSSQVNKHDQSSTTHSTESKRPIIDMPSITTDQHHSQQAHHPEPGVHQSHQDHSPPQSTQSTPVQSQSFPKNDGQVITLNSHNWEAYTHHAYNSHPTFVKYYTAWCKECRHLIPVWLDVAAQLKDTVNVAEFDCDAPWNKDVCKKLRLDSYPIFIIYHAGSKLVYGGPKTASAMIAFARMTSSDPGTHEVSLSELQQAVQTDSVVFLFLHSSSTSLEIMHAVTAAGKSLGGSAKILRSDSDEVFDRLSIPRGNPHLVVFKDHDNTAWSKIGMMEVDPQLEPSEMHRTNHLSIATKHWLAVNSIPIMDELNDSNFHRILSSGTEKLVVIACLSGISSGPRGINVEDSNMKSIQLKDDMKIWAQQWRKSQEARGKDTLVDWVWVNADVWSDWLYNTFGVNLPRPADDPRESSSIIITDAYKHVYYDSQENGQDIMFKPTSVFQTLLAIEMNKISGKLSGTFMGRMKWRFQRFKYYSGMLLSRNWLIFWIILIGIVALSVKAMKMQTSKTNNGIRSSSPVVGVGGISKNGGGLYQNHYSSSSPVHNPESHFNNNNNKTGFGHVFGLNSNVSLKAD